MGSFAKWGRKKEKTKSLCGIHHLICQVKKSEFFTQKRKHFFRPRR